MLRRDFVRAVVSVSMAPKLLLAQQTPNPAPPPPAPVPWTLGLNPNTPLPHTEVVDIVAETDLTFFSPQQMATLSRLCDVLLPSIGNKPGALQAKTPLFLDFLIGSSPEVRRKMYIDGLVWLDMEAQNRYKQTFARLSDTQTDTILRPWLRTWMSDHPPTDTHADFVNIAHDDVRTATVNSKAWSDVASTHGQQSTAVALYWSPIEPSIDGESSKPRRPSTHITVAPKTTHPITPFPR